MLAGELTYLHTITLWGASGDTGDPGAGHVLQAKSWNYDQEHNFFFFVAAVYVWQKNIGQIYSHLSRDI